MLIIRAITVDEVRRAEPLVRDHYNEVAKKKHLRVLDPDWVRYEALDAAGKLFCIGAFDGDVLVGYSMNLDVHEHLHYRGLHYVQNDVLFLAKSHRNGGAGSRLMRETKRIAKERGASEMLWHAKKDSELDVALRQRAELVDLIYSQEL